MKDTMPTPIPGTNQSAMLKFGGSVLCPHRILALACLAAAGPSTVSSAPPPNIVMIFADDLGWSDVGFNGSRFYETPHLDRLAASGMRFSDAYVAAPNCAPSRASLLTGRYPPGTGCYTVGRPDNMPGVAEGMAKLTLPENQGSLALDQVIMAQPLREAGYKTAYFGKWHVGDSGDYVATKRGFSHGFILPKAHLQDDFGPFTTIPSVPNSIGAYQGDFLTEAALDFVAANHSDPFFVFLSFYNMVHATNKGTHTSPDSALTGKYFGKPPSGDDKDPVYAAKVEHLDSLVGRILARLDELGLSSNTLVIFYSDNGGAGNYTALGSPGTRTFTDNRPLRGGKSTLYEGGIRVPLVMRWPGRIPAGSLCTVPVTGVDFFPTFLDLAGISLQESLPLDGVSLLPLMEGRPPPTGSSHESGGRMLWSAYVDRRPERRNDASEVGLDAGGNLLAGTRPIFWHFPVYYGDRLQNSAWVNTPNSAIRLGRFKLIEFFEDGHLELYDLKRDLSESENLAERHPAITAQLHTLLKQWQQESGAFIPQPVASQGAH